MKQILGLLSTLLVAGALMSFLPNPTPNANTTIDLETNIDLEASYVKYTGYKQVGSKHYGKLFFQSGQLELTDGQLSGGSFVVDMNSMTNDDIKNFKGKFLKHMKSDDFFAVAKYPTASFTISSVEEGDDGFSHVINGAMTIKDITKNIAVPANIKINGESVSIEGSAKIDRTDFGIKYGSGNFFKELTANKV
ncbi:MAG: YceI family protein, partial [Saprospiraceae bacterium]|nr:YceI family protein [Saprospiraceae bacterium]